MGPSILQGRFKDEIQAIFRGEIITQESTLFVWHNASLGSMDALK